MYFTYKWKSMPGVREAALLENLLPAHRAMDWEIIMTVKVHASSQLI